MGVASMRPTDNGKIHRAVSGIGLTFAIAVVTSLTIFLSPCAPLAADDTITLDANWAPFTDSKYGFGDRWETLQQLRPSKQSQTYSQQQFQFILPPEGDRLRRRVAFGRFAGRRDLETASSWRHRPIARPARKGRLRVHRSEKR